MEGRSLRAANCGGAESAPYHGQSSRPAISARDEAGLFDGRANFGNIVNKNAIYPIPANGYSSWQQPCPIEARTWTWFRKSF